IKITPDGKVKILDFGLAKAFAGESTRVDLSSMPAGTQEGVILGTAAYMSPEQARGQAVDKRADIWAFGCVLYEMITGRSLFARETFSDTLAAIPGHDPALHELPSGFPPVIFRLLKRCLERDVKLRLRDMGDVRADIDDALSTDRTSTNPRFGSHARF